jgi:hypothetical protein
VVWCKLLMIFFWPLAFDFALDLDLASTLCEPQSTAFIWS